MVWCRTMWTSQARAAHLKGVPLQLSNCILDSEEPHSVLTIYTDSESDPLKVTTSAFQMPNMVGETQPTSETHSYIYICLDYSIWGLFLYSKLPWSLPLHLFICLSTTCLYHPTYKELVIHTVMPRFPLIWYPLIWLTTDVGVHL